MRKSIIETLVVLVFVLSVRGQQKEEESLRVYLSGACSDNSTGAVVESSLRENIRSSNGYVLVREQEAGTFFISLACINAGEDGEGWTAIAYHYGLLTKDVPENLGVALWNPTLGVFTVGRAHAQSKGQELFARFDNDLHRR